MLPADKASVWKKMVLALCALIVADVLGAQLLKAVLPSWESFRVPSETYNHGFAKMADSVAVWGPFRYSMRTNSLGFKDETNRLVPLESDHRRVVLIGDSFTEGIGYEFGKTFAGILAKELAEDEVEVLNAGVTLYAPAIYYRKTKYLIEDVGLKFDGLVVFLDMSDIQEEAELYAIDENDRVRMHAPERVAAWIGNITRTQKLKTFLRMNSVLVRVLDMVKDSFVAEMSEAESPALDGPRSLWAVDEKWFDEFGRRGMEKAQQSMDRLASVLRKHLIDLTIVVYPWPDQVALNDLESKQVTYWRERAKRSDARFVTLFPPFFEGDRNEVLTRYFIPGDMHFNEAGHQLIASEFLERCDLTRKWK